MDGSDRIEIMVPDRDKELGLPYSEGGVRAGFPSPAEDFMPRHIDLNREPCLRGKHDGGRDR